MELPLYFAALSSGCIEEYLLQKAIPVTPVPVDQLFYRVNRLYHQSPMQTEKSQPEGKRIMPETRFTKFPALSFDPRVGISQSASETND